MQSQKVFGRNVSFPYAWTKPGEIRYDSTGFYLVKGWWPWVFVRAWLRRHILRRSPFFWMKRH